MFVTLNNGVIFQVHEIQSVPGTSVTFRLYPAILRPDKSKFYLSKLTDSFAQMEFNAEACRWTICGHLERRIIPPSIAKFTWIKQVYFPEHYPFKPDQVRHNLMAVETMFFSYRKLINKQSVAFEDAVVL